VLGYRINVPRVHIGRVGLEDAPGLSDEPGETTALVADELGIATNAFPLPLLNPPLSLRPDCFQRRKTLRDFG
jgi:hypothetical protein